MKTTYLIIFAILLVLVGGGAFFAGMKFQQNQRGQFARGGLSGALGQRFVNGSNRPVSGQIISSDDKSITVKLMNGSSKIVLISSTTAINKSAKGTTDDLTSGQNVLVIGTTNSDGSITASNIQLGFQFRQRAGSQGM